MKNNLACSLVCIHTLCILTSSLTAQNKTEDPFPVRGFCIAAPKANGIDDFVKFIKNELATRQVNTLVLRVDFNYQFENHPELRDSAALSKADVKKLVEACKSSNIRIIPQINLLGHQSWAGTTNNLLRVYPQFDETPGVKMPARYEWPNADGLYCKSYCPLHPDVHAVVFSLVDEIVDAFESNAFHAGMDEVFYIVCRRSARPPRSSRTKKQATMDLGRSPARWQDHRSRNVGSEPQQHLPGN
jgi:Glycosyl hydrolase family 20, catalytic domain